MAQTQITPSPSVQRVSRALIAMYQGRATAEDRQVHSNWAGSLKGGPKAQRDAMKAQYDLAGVPWEGL